MALTFLSDMSKFKLPHQAEQDWLREPESVDIDEELRKDAERGDEQRDLED